MNVRCPSCGEAVALAVGDTRLACAACGLATPVSRVGTEPGGVALVTLESDLTGTTLAGRAILERIGAGGMGTVYRAKGETGDVAIKVLRPGLGTDRSAMLARFAREAEALRRLEHARVVRFLDHGEDRTIAYIVTELVHGRDLSATLAAGRMSLAEIVDIFGQVCDGVAAAHAAGIVHRDLKPANILVGNEGGVKVADFGLAQLGSDAGITTLTHTNVAMGTFHYLAPEQRKDARAVDHRADIWALGVILYEMLTGDLPLGSFAPPSTKGPPGCDRRADAIVNRALAPDPSDRFATVSELGDAVRALWARPRASRSWIALAATIVLAGGTAGAVAMSGGGDNERPMLTPTTIDAAPGVSVGSLDAAPNVAVASLDAALDAALDATLVAAVPVDAQVPIVAAVAPARAGSGASRPTASRPTVSAIKRPTVTAAVKKPTATKVTGGKVTKGKFTEEELVSAICTSARKCCTAVKGGNCGSFAEADTETCASALVGFRDRATNPKQRAVCK